MTVKQPRTVQLTCDDCGHTTPVTTRGLAEHAMRKHSCATVKERAARAQRRLDRLAESGEKRDCQCPVAKHEHGTHAAYVVDKCRCRPCRDGSSRYERDRQRRHLYGKTFYVPAEPARAHVRALGEQGMGWKRVARAAGISESIVWKLLYGDASRGMAPSKKIRPKTAQALLAVKLDVAPGQKVDPTGTGRRLQALVTLGWSIGRISTETGLDRQCLDAAVHFQGITAATRDAVARAYDRLWNQAPPQTNQRERIAYSRSRRRATLNGWAPPMAWDDDTIDDPQATPDLGTDLRPGGKRVHVDDIEWLLEDQPLATAQWLADRLGVTKDAVQQACRRAERTDLVERLARNAELRGAAA